MADSAQAGIQQLLQAEEEAAKIINRAKQDRTERIKDARRQADAEVASFKKQSEEDFKRKEAEVGLCLVWVGWCGGSSRHRCRQ